VFPPTVSIQQLQVLPNGQWQLTVRIQNNSYGEMDFNSLEGQLQIGTLIPIRLHATFELDVPALVGDVIQLDVLPTTAMTQALQAIANKGQRRLAGLSRQRQHQRQAGTGKADARLQLQRQRLAFGRTRHPQHLSLTPTFRTKPYEPQESP
jgi:hypothetical protein